MSNGKSKKVPEGEGEWTDKHSEESQKKMIKDARKKGLLKRWESFESKESKEKKKKSWKEKLLEKLKELKEKGSKIEPMSYDYKKGGKIKKSSHSRGFSQHD